MRLYNAITGGENMKRIGEKGDISLIRGGCNPELGLTGLEKISLSSENPTQYLSNTGKHFIDVQLNIKKFGEVLQDGIDNTKEMAKAWNWHSDSDELNWRGKPCTLRTFYNKNTEIFQVHVWNELLQIWINLSLTKDEILKIIN